MLGIISRLRQLYGVRSIPNALWFSVGLAIVLCLPLIVSGQCVGGRCANRSQIVRKVDSQKSVVKTSSSRRSGGFLGWLRGRR